MNIVYFEGVKATVQQFKFKFLAIAILAVSSLGFMACGGDNTAKTGDVPAGNAATVNGKAITMEEVDRVIDQQTQGQKAKASPLELAQVRLQVLQDLIQTEVMYQKAEKEKTIPTDDEVTTAFNKMKTDSGRSSEDFQKEMEKQGVTEAIIRDNLKKQLAIQKLIEKITGKVDVPKDSEIEAFFKGNPDAFIKRKGVKLAAIVIDPRKNSETDKTVDQASAELQIREISTKLSQGTDFATVVREYSEDVSRNQNGDLGYISEEQLKQSYPQLLGFMDPQVQIGKLAGPFNIEGRFFIFKLVERSDKDEAQTLETPGIRQQITDALTNGRKNLIRDAYIAQSMNEARIDNLLLKKIIDNPNELSGARPAVSPDANANTAAANTGSNTNTANTASNAANAKKPEAKPAANTAKPANAK